MNIVPAVSIKIKMDSLDVNIVPPVNIKIKMSKPDVNNVQMVNTKIKTNKVAANPVEKDYTLPLKVQQAVLHVLLVSINLLPPPNIHVPFVCKDSSS